MRLLLFGTGDYYHRLKKWFNSEDILALLDNNKSLQGSYIDNIQVMSPEEGIRLDYDLVVVLSVYITEMKEQLIKLGVPENKIIHFYELHKILSYKNDRRRLTIYGNTEGYSGKKILLLTQDLTLGGPAIALQHMGESLRRFGYDVVFASMEDGPLRQMLLDEGFPVVIDENMQIFTMNECSWTEKYDLVVANTINFYYFLSERNTSRKVIWWMHDSEFFYHGVEKKILASMDMANITMTSVGPVPARAFRKYRSDVNFYNLCYGVTDVSNSNYHRKNDNIRFVTIGFIEWRKGQDILVKAIDSLDENILSRSTFTFVGSDTSAMAGSLKKNMRHLKNVTFTGKVNRKKINELLSSSDVMICPSREDPMPTVAAEAMMHSMPCILSDATGTAEYIDDGKNGLVFSSENADDLKNQITWCVNNADKINTMRPKARKVYEEHFTEDIFEKDLLRLIKEAL